MAGSGRLVLNILWEVESWLQKYVEGGTGGR